MAAPARRPRAVPRLLCVAPVCLLLACRLLAPGGRSGPGAEGQLALVGTKKLLVKGAVNSHFPGAIPGFDAVDLMLGAMRRYGVERYNVVYGQCICPDEINGNRGHVTTVLTNYYGRNFNLGGLGGVPFVGKTGFAAFSHHVPDDGHVVIVFGPHIGISPEGEPGKVLRAGQKELSTACGALTACYAQCTGDTKVPSDARDIEQSWLREKLAKDCREIAKNSKCPMVDVAMRAYSKIEEEIFAIVNTNYGSGNLVLVGGIGLNMPYKMGDYFLPLHFSIRSESKDPVDLMNVFM